MVFDSLIGKSVTRVDGYNKVTGAAIYGADLDQPNQLYGAVYRSPYPHARILSVDTSKAEAFPGVRAVVTGKEMPIRYGINVGDEPFLAFDKVRYFGEPVAAVAADTLEIAKAAAKLITAEYELLPVVTDPVEALKPGSPVVHESWADYKKGKAKCVEGSNLVDKFQIRKGDVEAGFKQSDAIVENDFEVGNIHHVTIETHMSTVMVGNRGEVTCWSSAQSPFVLKNYFMKTLGLSNNEVRIINNYVGGGFGGKYDLRSEMIAYVLANKLRNTPIKVVYDRHEDLIATVDRGNVRVHIKTGANKEGKIMAQKITIYWDTGAYTTMGPNVAVNGAIASPGPYEIPNVWVDSYCVVTNKPVCGAFRGFGVPETNWAAENQINLLAAKLGIDPLEMRLKNGLYEGAISVTGEKLFSVGLKPALETIKKEMEWEKTPLRYIDENGMLHGKGIACFLKMTSSPSNSSCIIKLNEDGTAVLIEGGSEMGQGSHTVMTQIIMEELGLDKDKIHIPVTVDTDYTPYDKSTTSSRHTFMMGNAVLKACEDVKLQVRERVSASWGLSLDGVQVDNGEIREIGGQNRCYRIQDIASIPGIIKEMPPIVGRGNFSTAPVIKPTDPLTGQSERPTAFWIYGAQAAEVVVDPATGETQIERFFAAHDCGNVINSHTATQQVGGAVVMGLGHALREELIYKDGVPKNANMVDYAIPTFQDFIVEPNISFVDAPHKEGPYGAKGVGETALTATGAAVGMAVSNAVGKQFFKMPMTSENIYMALHEKD